MNLASVSKYFWEFFMLFLAITLGFFIENYRLKLLDQDYELSMAKSFKSDLQKVRNHLDSIFQEEKGVKSKSILLLKPLKKKHLM